MNPRIFVLVGTVFGMFACEKAEKSVESARSKTTGEVAVADRIVQKERAIAPEVPEVPAEKEPEAKKDVPLPGAIVYAEGDRYQGMWNHDRRNSSIELVVRSVNPEERTILAAIRSVDLDNQEKEFEGTIGEDGRRMILTGIAGTGGDYEPVSGYHVSDFLRKSSSTKITLGDCSNLKLRGNVENGTNIYFWTKVKEE